MRGYIYIIRCENFYKIGKTQDIEARLSSFNTGNPFPMTLILCSEVEEVDEVEKELHSMACGNKAHIVKGEWYKLCDKVLEQIVRMIIQATDYDNPPFHCGCKWNR